MGKLKKLLIAVLVLVLELSVVPAGIVHAASASLYITPSSSSQAVGNNFTVYVGLNTGGNAVNAIEATVNLPTNVVSITGAGTGGSLCSIWVQNPTISGSSVSFKCGIPGGTTSNGTLISISLAASAVGSGNGSISGARVLAGPGDNVTGGTSGATFNVTAASSGSGGSSSSGSRSTTYKAQPTGTPAPDVTSSSHSDQNGWSKNKTVDVSWTRPAGVTGFSYAFDQSDSTVPAASSNSNATSLNLPDKGDGVWYFHIRANGPNGWSSTTNYRVQIDTAAPTNLVVTTDPKGESGKRPLVSFNAEDATSGIDHYEIKMDQEAFKRVSSPYMPDSIKSGNHTFTVRAYDKAGNMIENKVSIRIKDVPIPKITKPRQNATFKLIQSLDIAGTGDSSTKIDLYIDGVNIAKGLTVKDDGTWSMTYKSLIMPGKHKITAVAIRDGIESKTSDSVTVQIDPSAISIFGMLVPSILVFIILLTIIGLLVLLVIWMFIFIQRHKSSFRGKSKKDKLETEAEVGKDFSVAEQKIKKDIDGTYKDKKLLTSKEKHHLEDKIKKDLRTAENAVIDTIEKEPKGR